MCLWATRDPIETCEWSGPVWEHRAGVTTRSTLGRGNLVTGSNSSTASGGIGFGGALALLFIGLKLGHVIDWSWWWVLSPLWIPLVFVAVILLIAGFVALVKR